MFHRFPCFPTSVRHSYNILMSFLFPFQTIEGKYAVCANCGQLSSDYNVCEGCSKNLPDKPNYFWPSIAKNPPDEEPSKSFSLADAGTRAGKSQSRIVRILSSSLL